MMIIEDEKLKVIIEEIEDEKVAIYEYDESGKEIMISPIEICHKVVAMEQYEIVGELINGEIELYNSVIEEEEDFSEFSLIDEDDDNV